MENLKLRGFTLLELLVVIAIIGILTALLAVNLQGVRSRARDVQRKSDLKQIQKALEMYKQDNNRYPGATTWAAFTTAMGTAYMQEVPNDPLGGKTYFYTSPFVGVDVFTYQMFACLENAVDPDKDTTTQTDCSGTGASYTLIEP